MIKYDEYDPWPDVLTSREHRLKLQNLFPESKLLMLIGLSFSDRKAAYEDLGITNSAQQADLELQIQDLIDSLAKKHHGLA